MTPTVNQLFWILAALAALGASAVLASCAWLPKPIQRPKLPAIGIVGGTGSMVPAYNFADLVESDDVPFNDLVVGDVVLRRVGAFHTVMHRIVAAGVAGNGEKFFITAGDALPKRDMGFMDADSYFGRIRLVKRASK